MKIIKKEIGGVEYTFQKIPAMDFVRMKERATNDKGVLLDSAMFEELAEHVIVDPKIDLEGFEDVVELSEIMEEAISFQLSKKQPAPGQKKSKG